MARDIPKAVNVCLPCTQIYVSKKRICCGEVGRRIRKLDPRATRRFCCGLLRPSHIMSGSGGLRVTATLSPTSPFTYQQSRYVQQRWRFGLIRDWLFVIGRTREPSIDNLEAFACCRQPNNKAGIDTTMQHAKYALFQPTGAVTSIPG
jgi:hypothetical protein